MTAPKLTPTMRKALEVLDANSRPLSAFARQCLDSMDPSDVFHRDDRNMWKASSKDMMYGTEIIHRLVARGLLEKLDADTVKLTDAGRLALAQIKERT
jgi:hypothetical protein